MGVRVAIDDHRKLTIGVVTVLILGAAYFIYRQASSAGIETRPITKVYFTTDDGATRFADKVERVPPFKKDGHEAVRCHVFKSDRSGEFVGYLERLSPAVLERARNAMPKSAQHDGVGPLQSLGMELIQEATEVKKPGAGEWVNRRTASGSEITNVRSPAGEGGDLQVVLPPQ